MDPTFPVALLRIALALKMEPRAGLDEIIERTTQSMRLSRRDFRAYLADHMAMLAQAATDVKAPAAPTKRRPALVHASAPARRIKLRSPR